jgi:hypothetical protein
MEILQPAPFETRIQAAVSVCAVTTFRHKTEALLIAGPEQNLYGTLGYGIDHPELLATVALRDFVPIEGVRRTCQEVRRVYAVLGCPEKVAMFTTDDQHSLNLEMLEATASWVARWLAGRTEPIHESPRNGARGTGPRCTATGQVAESLHGETVSSLNVKLADRIAPKRKLPSTRGQCEVYRREIGQLVTRVTRPDLAGAETGITAPIRSSCPAGRIVVMVAESGKDDPALLRDVVGPLNDAGYRVAGLDARGWGETLPSMPETKEKYPWDELDAARQWKWLWRRILFEPKPKRAAQYIGSAMSGELSKAAKNSSANWSMRPTRRPCGSRSRALPSSSIAGGEVRSMASK